MYETKGSFSVGKSRIDSIVQKFSLVKEMTSLRFWWWNWEWRGVIWRVCWSESVKL